MRSLQALRPLRRPGLAQGSRSARIRVLASGAEMRRALGLAVFSGMLGVFGIFLTPVFFYLLRRHSDRAAVAAEQKE